MHGYFQIFPIYWVVFECPNLYCLAPEWGKSEKWRRKEKGPGSLNSLQVTLAKELGDQIMEGGTVMAAPFFAPLWSESAISDQSTNLWYWMTGFCLPFLAPASCVQAALLLELVHSCLPFCCQRRRYSC